MGSWSVYEADSVGRPSIILRGAQYHNVLQQHNVAQQHNLPQQHNVPQQHNNSSMYPNSTHCNLIFSSVFCNSVPACKIHCVTLRHSIWYCGVLSCTVWNCLLLWDIVQGPRGNEPANPRKGIAHRKQDIEQRGAKGSISVIPHWSLVDRPTQLICIWIFIRQQANTKDIAGQSGPVAYHPPKIFLLH